MSCSFLHLPGQRNANARYASHAYSQVQNLRPVWKLVQVSLPYGVFALTVFPTPAIAALLQTLCEYSSASGRALPGAFLGGGVGGVGLTELADAGPMPAPADCELAAPGALEL